jgi:hypothetical protein
VLVVSHDASSGRQRTVENLVRLMLSYLRYWTVRRMLIAGYWDASAVFNDLAVVALMSLPPPDDNRLYVIVDKTIKQKSGKKLPWDIRHG